MNVSSNKASDIFKYYLKKLEEHYTSSEAKSLLYILFEHYFEFGKIDFVKDAEKRLSESELLKIHFAVTELMSYKPIQYIVGSTEFCGIKFKVSPEVLVPRPETEELVDLIIHENKSINHPISILDIGTGSGCIAIVLKKKFHDSFVQAIDISEEALKIANKNAELNQAAVEFKKIDVLKSEETTSLSKFDLIVSNPPYIRNLEKELMHENVLEYEPEEALFVSDANPLIFYKAIAELGLKYLKSPGKLYFEINEAFGYETSELLKNFNYSDIKVLKDFNGKDRFVRASLFQQ